LPFLYIPVLQLVLSDVTGTSWAQFLGKPTKDRGTQTGAFGHKSSVYRWKHDEALLSIPQ